MGFDGIVVWDMSLQSRKHGKILYLLAAPCSLQLLLKVLLPSSVKPKLPSKAKLAELQPYFAFHPARQSILLQPQLAL